ncbi:MAG: pantoate--beta-alanine ligase [Gemmatimonadales bacterium]
MDLLPSIETLRAWVSGVRARDETIGFVPTMGSLHEGHLALVDAARLRADRVVVSVFVNPLQFGPEEDLARYPRDEARDRRLAEGRGADAMFLPSTGEMYPAGASVRVVPGPSADRWEGAARPGHFSGVLTVVAKLFNLVQPDLAFFGQKDIQQAVLVRQMVRDLNFPVEVVVSPTVREPDGLALSSRNVYLSPEEREQALALSRALAAAHAAWCANERRASMLEAVMREELRVSPAVSVEYIAIVDSGNMEPVVEVTPATAIAVAARVGKTRLIDNLVLQQGLGTWNEG